MDTHPADERWMSLALALGRRGLGRTAPNPAVGCVIIKRGTLVGRGWTQAGGRPHAEVMALAQAGPLAKGATVYVTLEPCAHFGKSPPCAKALIAAGITRLVAAVQDPDPRVAGKGFALLKQAGIAVETTCLEDQARWDHLGFFLRVQSARPFVTLKLASSFDGRIATAAGESQWITGPHARRYTHHLRATHDAVLVGAGTVRADNPSLTVRGFGDIKQSTRIFCDSRLTTRPDCVLGSTARQVPLWIFHGPKADPDAIAAWQKTGALLFNVPLKNHQVDMAEVLKTLAQQGLTRVFCEGGGQMAASLLTADLVDQLIGFSAGIILGGEGRAAIAALPTRPLAEMPQFSLASQQRIGKDLLHIWRKTTP